MWWLTRLTVYCKRLCGSTCTLRWRHNDHAGVSNHQPHGCLLNRSFRRKSKKTSKLCVTGLCAGNSSGTGEFPAQMASYAENVSIWWRHHDNIVSVLYSLAFSSLSKLNFHNYVMQRKYLSCIYSVWGFNNFLILSIKHMVGHTQTFHLVSFSIYVSLSYTGTYFLGFTKPFWFLIT